MALDPETKIVPTYFVGKRTAENAYAFMRDLHSRLANRVQISTDGLSSYINAVEDAFGGDVDFGQPTRLRVMQFADRIALAEDAWKTERSGNHQPPWRA